MQAFVNQSLHLFRQQFEMRWGNELSPGTAWYLLRQHFSNHLFDAYVNEVNVVDRHLSDSSESGSEESDESEELNREWSPIPDSPQSPEPPAVPGLHTEEHTGFARLQDRPVTNEAQDSDLEVEFEPVPSDDDSPPYNPNYTSSDSEAETIFEVHRSSDDESEEEQFPREVSAED